MTKVTWQIKGQKTERVTYVPDGEVYVDWIAQSWGVDPSIVVVLNTDAGVAK